MKKNTTGFKDGSRNPKRKRKFHNAFPNKLETIYTFVVFATSSTSVTLTVTGFELIKIPTSAGVVCELTLTKEVLYEKTMNKNNI